MKFAEYKPARRKAVTNGDTVRIATISWKLIRISSTTTIKSQTHRTNQHEQDITIHNAGFTEANLRGQLKKPTNGNSQKGISKLPMPFAAYYNCMDDPIKRLVKLR